MINFRLLLLSAIILVWSCKRNDVVSNAGQVSADKLQTFISKHPDFSAYKSDMQKLYEKEGNRYVWFDENGRNDFAEVLYDRASQMGSEGVPGPLPYSQEISSIFSGNAKAKPEDDLLISAMYFFYVGKVYKGLDAKTTKKLGWFLPRQRDTYISYLDTLMQDPSLLKNNESENISQYYNLKKALTKFRAIQKRGGWQSVTLPEKISLKPGETSPLIAQLRKRLAVTSDFTGDTVSTNYDETLIAAVKSYRNKQNLKESDLIDDDLIASLNVSVADRIRTIVVNMERCRWIDTEFDKASEYIFVNVPSYHLDYTRDGRKTLESNVVVGDEGNKTVIFSGKISYLVFSPYWNIPESIVEKEIKPGLAKDKKYLEKHRMERHNGHIRQLPGDDNSLGLVKFMFPNSNNIYLHDTPAKGLFEREARALSHGCVRVQKARELAILLLDGEPEWDAGKIDEAMHSGKETKHPLKRKIPVYIAYFTAWADENGNVSFYDDIYQRDNRLASLLYKS